jgi:Tol biopolymer transport system component
LTPWSENVEYVPSSFSPDASVLAVTKSDFESDESRVLLLGVGSSRRVRVLGRRTSEAVFSPDGSQIAFARHTVVRQRVAPRRKIPIVVNKDLYVTSVDGTGSRAVTHTHRIAETRPSWDPSGQRLAFNSFRISKDLIEAIFDELLPFGNSIVQVNADGSCRQKIASLRNAALLGPVWRPGLDHAAGRIEC